MTDLNRSGGLLNVGACQLKRGTFGGFPVESVEVGSSFLEAGEMMVSKSVE